MAAEELSFAQNATGNIKLQPYVVALVRWCISYVWGTATVVIHRFMTTPALLDAVPDKRALLLTKPPIRTPSNGHIHPEARVQCVVLHEPRCTPELDIIFAHGLYGSLENTWRQGDWRTKYKIEPNRIPLKRPNSIPNTCSCEKCKCKSKSHYPEKIHPKNCVCRDKIQNPTENLNSDISECNKIYHLVNKINSIDNIEAQAFVRHLFECQSDKEEFYENDNSYISDNDSGFYKNDKCLGNFNNEKYTCVNSFNDKNKNNDNINNFNLNNERYLPNLGTKNLSDDIIYNDISRHDNEKSDFPNNINTKSVFSSNNDKRRELSKNDNGKSKLSKNDMVKKVLSKSDKVKTELSKNDNGKTELSKNDKVKSELSKNDNVCEVGCGCICDDCYSECWPRDWLSVDYPKSRIISINYTSDPYLWRPLWVKECKRLRLQERAEQMTTQLLELGVGQRPIVWVGHSKGGLFIKQIYAEAYEAHLKLQELNSQPNKTSDTQKHSQNNNKTSDNDNQIIDVGKHDKNDFKVDFDSKTNSTQSFEETNIYDNDKQNKDLINHKKGDFKVCLESKSGIDENLLKPSTDTNNSQCDNKIIEMINHVKSYSKVQLEDKTSIDKNSTENSIDNNISESDKNIIKIINHGNNDFEVNFENNTTIDKNLEESSRDNNNSESDENSLEMIHSENRRDIDKNLAERASLWSNSAAFMFYSVPHRGSPLADIKTPITARSIELLEISKDCSLVLTLQDRWLRATGPLAPVVRSLVETNRTLMAVLWLKIVSVESADAGIGALCGISLDHREICKPSSRSCVLYTELLKLMHAGLNKLSGNERAR